MIQEEKLSSLVNQTTAKVRVRREKLSEATQEIQESMEYILSKIENMPKGIVLFTKADKTLIGITDGKSMKEDPFIAIWVEWVETSVSNPSIEYNLRIKDQPDNVPNVFQSLESMLENFLEFFIEYVEIYNDSLKRVEAIKQAMPTQPERSAPVDAMARIKYVANIIDDTGEHTVYIEALSKSEARDLLRQKYENIMEITECKE